MHSTGKCSKICPVRRIVVLGIFSAENNLFLCKFLKIHIEFLSNSFLTSKCVEKVSVYRGIINGQNFF